MPSATSALELETRTCINGCGRSFKCLPTSKSVTAFIDCDQRCLKKPPDAASKRRSKIKFNTLPLPSSYSARKGDKPIYLRPKAPSPDPRPGATAEEVSTKERTAIWLACVEEAKKVTSNLNQSRHRLIYLAVKACDIQKGGGAHWSEFKGVFTLRRFADEVGIAYRTLWNWVDAYRKVISALPEGEYGEGDLKFAMRSAVKVPPDGDYIKKFRQLRGESKEFHMFSSMLKWATSHRNFVRDRDLSKVDQTELTIYYEILLDTVNHLGDYLYPSEHKKVT